MVWTASTKKIAYKARIADRDNTRKATLNISLATILITYIDQYSHLVHEDERGIVIALRRTQEVVIPRIWRDQYFKRQG